MGVPHQRTHEGPQSEHVGQNGSGNSAIAKVAACTSPAAVVAGGGGALQRAERKVLRHVLTLACAIALINYIDRGNLAFAALSLNKDRQFSAQVFSTGASLFFVAICIFQVPSNLVMVRVGFRPWLAFLLVGWGAVAVCFMFISSAWSFYLLRMLLGAFESGAFPAMWHALGVFFPRRRITKPFAYLTVGIMAANMIGAPLAAGLLAMNGLGGLRGWQWLFMLEGIPSVVLGVVVFLTLPGSISAARWLTPEERAALEAAVSRDHVPGPLAEDLRGALSMLRDTLRNKYLWLCNLCGCLTSVASHTYLLFTPIIIANLLAGTALSNESTVAAKGTTQDLRPVGLSVVPYTLAVISAYAIAASSQRHHEQFFHVASSLVVAGVIMSLFAPLARAAVAAGFLSLALSLAIGAGANGPALTLVSRLCTGPYHVVALPLFSSFTVVGGVVGPLVAGKLMNSLGGFTYITIIMGGLMFVTGLLILVLSFWVKREGGLPEGGVAQRVQSAVSSRVPALPAPSGEAYVVGRSQGAAKSSV